ncbi:RNA polymerase sigma-70 factor [Intrasporangium sp.]|uniref:RNA polymerase sigma-70 factor n=1 Tax=Intrasporangium sp. TaxID=1925024 RepID=UPI00293B8671|nr:RNA polymerase sigma-70 factor [Intrasporangium sp.]MDV3223087.1 RNA polymerase sigma-70 factor [Intrasporangium sp.]
MSSEASIEEFESRRSLLFTVAYELLGSAVEAEDVVQDTWLQWAKVDHAQVRDARAFLTRIVTRQALNRLRTLSRRRETYVGEWLPEPVLTTPDVAEDVELAESVSIAMLRVLETLGPTERAVFVLHEVFAVPYDEIAAAIDKKPAAVRQIAHRARSHVNARSPRLRVSRAEQTEVVNRLLAAIRTGDLAGLMNVLAPDVVALGDGGGLVRAAARPITGPRRVATSLMLLGRAEGVSLDAAWVNGAVAIRVEHHGALHAVISIQAEAGHVTALYGVNNPEKLTRIDRVTPLTT